MPGLSIFDVTGNAFYGLIPADIFSHKPTLETLLLGSNSFSGALPINMSRSLVKLDISDNAFSGTLPSEYFTLQHLTIFFASMNCLSPTLSTSLCNSSNALSELYLDGLQENSKCSDATKRDRGYLTNLPSCIWSRSSLRKLYLSGNGYSGNMEKTFELPNIIELGVGSNRLYGSLPVALSNRSMDYFDVSSNHFDGSLRSISITSGYGSGNTTFKADVNRLSGPISLSTLDTFSDVNVLSGNVISCSTLPLDDPNYSTYACGSHDLDVSVYFWLGTAFACVFILCICVYFGPQWFVKMREQISERDMMCSDEIKVRFPRTVQYLYSLKRLAQATTMITVFVSGVTVAMYCSFNLSPSSSRFSSRAYQYSFLVSGVFLKGPDPAFALVVLHSAGIYLLSSVYYIVFVKDWGVMRLDEDASRSYESSQSDVKLESADKGGTFGPRETATLKEPEERRETARASTSVNGTMTTWLGYAFKAFAVLSYSMASVVTNSGYIFLRSKVSSSQLFFLELALLALNYLLSSCNLSEFVELLFPDMPHSLYAARVVVFLVCFTDIVVPFIATLISDDRCFHQTIVTPVPIKLSYSYNTCILYQFINEVYTGCVEYLVTERSLLFTPPFIYSGECRTAVLSNFLPVIIVLSAIRGFLSPLYELFLTRNEKDLTAKVWLFGWLELSSLDSYILTDSRMRITMAYIWSSLLMLLTYGIVSPYAAVAIGASTVAQICYLRANICRYFHLEQSSNVSGAEDSDKGSVRSGNIESFCRDSQSTVDAMLWPGVMMASILFAFYVFDMAYDTDSLDLAAPLSCLLLTLMVLPAAMLIYYYSKKRLAQQRIEIRSHLTSVEIPEVTNPLSQIATTTSR